MSTKGNPDGQKPSPGQNSIKSDRAAPAAGKAKFTANSRSTDERRKGGDRREEIRFEESRRAGKDRRPRKSWAPDKNL